MNFITGTFAIFAPSSALNNGKGEGNTTQVKAIRSGRYEYPYVSAQALRYWLRETISQHIPEWEFAPLYRGTTGKQQAYTEGNPIMYWDDDLMGYMRAEKNETGKKKMTRTRISPFRVSTLVSATPVEIVSDFGTMGRSEGDFVLHEHEFYRTTLVGTFSIDLNAVGTFTYVDRSGFHNLSSEQKSQAEKMGLEHYPEDAAYRLPLAERMTRVSALLRAFGRLQGGANQTLHHTDVSPALVCMAVLQGGNNPFMHIVDTKQELAIHEDVLVEALDVYRDDWKSAIYCGVKRGFNDSIIESLEKYKLHVRHPRQTFDALAEDLFNHPEWFA